MRSTFKEWLKWRRQKKDEQVLQSMAIGVNSTVDNVQDLHCLFFDYDGQKRERVIESVKELQEFWHLSDISVYKTKNGYHAIAWYDHVPYERAKMIIDYARAVDPQFKFISRFYNHKTLRVAGKHKQRDIFLDCVVPGKRIPTPLEVERGEIKRTEHKMLLSSERMNAEDVERVSKYTA